MSPVVYLKDNNCGISNVLENEMQYDDISHIANKTIEELLEENPNLLIFPQSLGINKDKIEELEILHLSGSKDNLKECKVKTGNLMGFIGYGNTQISITSRFAKNNNTKDDYFLHYLLQKVLCLNIFDLKYSAASFGEFDLLLYMFPALLKKAFAQGLVRKYKTFKNNDANIKGVVDVTRHIQNNIPFNGRVAYNNRNYTTDNSMTELIRHTIELIKTKPNGNFVLTSDYEMIECVRTIQENTPSYSKNDLSKIVSQNLNQFVHPFYTEYIPLQKLCLQILRFEKMNYAQSKDEAYGVVFDGAWLWEEFLATVLTGKGLDFTHPENKTGTNGIQVYTGNRRYPDFYRGKQTVPEKMEGNFVLDAKYKHFDVLKNDDILDGSFSRDDLHQLITYMHILPSKYGALIYPYDKGFREDTRSKKRTIRGYGGDVWTIGVPIPQNCYSLKELSSKMMDSEKYLKRILHEEINIAR